MSEASRDQALTTEVPKNVQDKFLSFRRDIQGDDIVTCDPNSLRITRKPKSLPTEPTADHLEQDNDFPSVFSENPGHTETIEYFHLNPQPLPGRFEFDHSAEVSFNVSRIKSEFRSLFLDTPQGDQFGLEVLPNPHQKIVKITGRKNESGIAFSITYDLNQGKLLDAELKTTDGTKKAYVDFSEPEPYKNASLKDKDIGKRVILPVGTSTVFLLRMPEAQGFGQLIASAFPADVFKNPSSTNKTNDASWLSVNWLNALNIKLMQNGKQIPFQF